MPSLHNMLWTLSSGLFTDKPSWCKFAFNHTVLLLQLCLCFGLPVSFYSLRLGCGYGEGFPSSSWGATSIPWLPSLPVTVSPHVSPTASQCSSLRWSRHRKPAGRQWEQHLRCSRLGLLKSWGGRCPTPRAATRVSDLQGETGGRAVWRGEECPDL